MWGGGEAILRTCTGMTEQAGGWFNLEGGCTCKFCTYWRLLAVAQVRVKVLVQNGLLFTLIDDSCKKQFISRGLHRESKKKIIMDKRKQNS